MSVSSANPDPIDDPGRAKCLECPRLAEATGDYGATHENPCIACHVAEREKRRRRLLPATLPQPSHAIH